MTFKTFLFAFLLLAFPKVYAQAKSDTSDVVYEPLMKDYFKDYKKAKFIVDYYFTDGSSTGNRYSYEIIVADNLLMLNFNSPKTDDYKYVAYNKQNFLDNSDITNLKRIIKKSQLKQTKKGVPRATFTAYTKEVLVVRFNGISVAGGFAYGNIASYPDSERTTQIKKEIADDRKQSSSIGGNYNLLISVLKKYFVDLDKLKAQSIKKW